MDPCIRALWRNERERERDRDRDRQTDRQRERDGQTETIRYLKNFTRKKCRKRTEWKNFWQQIRLFSDLLQV